MKPEIEAYNQSQQGDEITIYNRLALEIINQLPTAEYKIWHRHPVWFLDGNPVVGYCKMKVGIRLLFWSGQSFNEDELQPEGSFKAAEKRYLAAHEINETLLHRWLEKAQTIQWDYKNIVKRKGKLERLL